jgi:hypothetical protein
MKNEILQNLKSKYENDIAIAKTNIDIFLSSLQGVAEHIEYSETIEKELEKIANAQDKLEALSTVMLGQSNN